MTQNAKGYKGLGMEGSIARRYADSTGKDRARHEEQARMARERAHPGDRILEVAPGPGYTAIELAKDGAYEVTGLDISETFVEIAQCNADAAEVSVDFRLGNAAAMPFPDATFDFVICCAAFKNFAEPVGALREMRRVLRPAGRALIIDLRKDVTKSAVFDDVDRMGLGGFDKVMTRLILFRMLPRRAHTKAEFAEFISQSGFAASEINETPLSLEVDLYMDSPG